MVCEKNEIDQKRRFTKKKIFEIFIFCKFNFLKIVLFFDKKLFFLKKLFFFFFFLKKNFFFWEIFFFFFFFFWFRENRSTDFDDIWHKGGPWSRAGPYFLCLTLVNGQGHQRSNSRFYGNRFNSLSFWVREFI